MNKKIKIIFISYNFHFLQNFYNQLNPNNYEISTYNIKLSTSQLKDPKLKIIETNKLLEVIGDNDIVWVEWLLTPACLLSNVPNKKFKLICRLHSYEYFYNNNIYIKSTNFLNIDKLIVVNDWFKNKLINNYNVPESKIINLPILFDKYTNENNLNREKNIGVVGIKYLTNKGIDKILDIFEKLYQIDNEYKLHIKGNYNKKYTKNPFLSENESIELYNNTIKKMDNFLDKYSNNIIIHHHSDNGGEDMQTFYNQIGFLLCASIYESFHCSIMEAGSSGCIPIIYDYITYDVPKTPEQYILHKFNNYNDIVNIITTIKYKKKSLKVQKYYEMIDSKLLLKYEKFLEEVYYQSFYNTFSIGVILKKLNDLNEIQNKIINISNKFQNKYQNIKLFIFLDKEDFILKNITFIKCWKKGYLFGNSLIRIPKIIKSVKIIINNILENDIINILSNNNNNNNYIIQ